MQILVKPQSPFVVKRSITTTFNSRDGDTINQENLESVNLTSGEIEITLGENAKFSCETKDEEKIEVIIWESEMGSRLRVVMDRQRFIDFNKCFREFIVT